MASKLERDYREKRLRALAMSALSSGGIEGVMTRILDELDKLDELITFFAERKRGTILDLAPGQKLSRWEATLRLNQQMDRDPELYAEMTRHPRYLAAFVTQEAMGLPILSFLNRVKEVHFIEEQPGLHWLVLAACHHGCESVEAPEGQLTADSCHVCGRPQGPAGSSAQSQNVPATMLERIHAVDDYLERSVSLGGEFHDQVMNDPTGAFVKATLKLFGAGPEELFGIHEVRLAADTETMIYSVRLADHAPKRTRAAAPKEAVG
jgi:hypothetical protein